MELWNEVQRNIGKGCREHLGESWYESQFRAQYLEGVPCGSTDDREPCESEPCSEVLTKKVEAYAAGGNLRSQATLKKESLDEVTGLQRSLPH